MPHIPVLLTGETSPLFTFLSPQEGEKVLDATLGLGGHAQAFLGRIGAQGHLYGVDADALNLEEAGKRLAQVAGNVTCIQGNFRGIASMGLPMLDVIFADLGVSSPHFDDPSRGFTFRADAPLDLRFDRTQGQTAAALIATAPQEELKHIFQAFGEMRGSGRLASVLYHDVRHGKAIRTTAEFRALIERLYGFRAPSILPQAFQALRIAVNDELGALAEFLKAAPPLLAPGGRMGVISYHSLEDRMVKNAFRALCTTEKDDITGADTAAAPFILLTKKAVVPSAEEQKSNPRARSAKFRAIRRNE
ncbi:MAG: 16S rRNA (cytosine(1402)-N(4))-methyltransferase RsmH [Candidatus Peribacteraceae bacterium]|jgi:16S rRNA (cytosine1402-N4)-methyltransferase